MVRFRMNTRNIYIYICDGNRDSFSASLIKVFISFNKKKQKKKMTSG